VIKRWENGYIIEKEIGRVPVESEGNKNQFAGAAVAGSQRRAGLAGVCPAMALFIENTWKILLPFCLVGQRKGISISPRLVWGLQQVYIWPVSRFTRGLQAD
jgi:hypothetical protein